MRPGAKTLCLLALCCQLPEAASAQFTCAEPATNEWLKQGPLPGDDIAPIDGSRIHPVTRDLDMATALLLGRSSLPLEPTQVARFLGATPAPAAAEVENRLRPYLVRTVFPVSNPIFDIRWRGAALTVLTSGLGCAPFMKHPIIVYLEREPAEVFVMTDAAL